MFLRLESSFQCHITDLWALRQHLIKNKRDSLVEISAWTQEPGLSLHRQMQVKTLPYKEKE